MCTNYASLHSWQFVCVCVCVCFSFKFRKVRDTGGLVYLSRIKHLSYHVFYGWVTVSSQWTGSGCQLRPCMLTPKLTVNMLIWRVPILLSSNPRHYITLRYITLRYVALHYVTLHYITLHYHKTFVALNFLISALDVLCLHSAFSGNWNCQVECVFDFFQKSYLQLTIWLFSAYNISLQNGKSTCEA